MHRKTSEKLLHARSDRCRQLSRESANKHDVAYSEDPNAKGVTACAKGTAEAPDKHVAQEAGLNREIPDPGWHKFERCLGYRMRVEKVPAAYASRRRNACGCMAKANRKTQSDFESRSCGHRDNAVVDAA